MLADSGITVDELTGARDLREALYRLIDHARQDQTVSPLHRLYR